jgi:hypothetical protein
MVDGAESKGPACPGRTVDGWISALRMPDLVRCKASEVMDDFASGWVLTELLLPR